MLIPDGRFGTADRAADRLSHADLPRVCPVHKTALQGACRVPPEPAVVDIGIPVSKGDKFRIAVQQFSYPLFCGKQIGNIADKLLAERRCVYVLRKQFRETPDEIEHPVGALY